MDRGMRVRIGATILALLVGSGAAFAAPLPLGGSPRADFSTNPLSQAWDWVVSLFDATLAAFQTAPAATEGDGTERLSIQREDGGMGMDPNGGW